MEIIRTFVGSIGLVAAVPITTWLAATQMHRWMLKRQAGRAKAVPSSKPTLAWRDPGPVQGVVGDLFPSWDAGIRCVPSYSMTSVTVFDL